MAYRFHGSEQKAENSKVNGVENNVRSLSINYSSLQKFLNKETLDSDENMCAKSKLVVSNSVSVLEQIGSTATPSTVQFGEMK